MSPASTLPTSPPQRVVIAGAGVIGTCTAYFLAKHHGIRCTLVDPSGKIAPAASGKAGGFLARDWNDGSPTQDLTHRSFDLHQQLADELGADSILYRRVSCAAVSVDVRNTRRRPSSKKLEIIEWAKASDETTLSGLIGARPLGDTDTLAQVHPRLLCERLWQETSKPADKGGVGSEFVQGKVVEAVHDETTGKLVGARLDTGSTVPADAILFSCGPWTANILQGLKAHSVVVPTDRVLEQCVFFSGCGDPEVYVRADQTAYCCGFGDDAIDVTEEPGQEVVRPEKIATILKAVRDASSHDKGSALLLNEKPVAEQACYLPVTLNGVPVMGQLPSKTVGGNGPCYIAAGHSCWGILLGPASGEAMASLIATGKSEHVNLSSFDPKRFGDIKLRSN